MEEKFIQGVDDPELSEHKAPKRKVLVPLIIAGVIFLAVIFGAYKLLFRGETVTVKDTTTQIEGSSEEFQTLLDRIAARDRVIADLQANKEEVQAQLEAKFNELQNSMQNTDVQELRESLQILQNDLYQTIQEMNNREKPEEVFEEPTPQPGSSSTSVLYQNFALTKPQEVKDEAAWTDIDGILPGSGLPAKLLTGLVSSPLLDKVRAVVEITEDTVIDGFKIPAGTKFIGTPEEDLANTRRMYLPLDLMIVNNRAVPVKALAFTAAGNPGLVSKYVDPQLQSAWSSLIPNMLASAANFLQSSVTRVNSVTGNVTREVELTPKNAALQGASVSASEVANAIRANGARKTPLVIVNAGKALQVKFIEALPGKTLIEVLGK